MPEVYDAVVIGGGPGRLDRRDVALARRAARPRARAREVPALPRRRVAAALQPPDLRPARRPREDPRRRASRRSTAPSSGTRPTGRRARSSSPRRATRITPWPTRSSARTSTTCSCGTRPSCGAEVREETAVEDVLFEGGRAVGVRARAARRRAGGDPRPGRRRRLRPGRLPLAQARHAAVRPEAEARRALRALRRESAGPRAAGPATSCCRSTGASGTGSSPSRTGPAASAASSIRPRSAFAEGASRGGPVRRAARALAAGRRACSRGRAASPACTASRTTRPAPRSSAATAGSSSATRRRFSTRSSRPASSSRWRPESARPARSTARSRAAGRVDAARLRGVRAAGQPHGRPLPEVRLQLLRSRLLRGLLARRDPPEAIRAAVVTVLAGGVEHVSPAMWLWTRLMFVGVAIDRSATRRLARRAGRARVAEFTLRAAPSSGRPGPGFGPSHTAKRASAKSRPSIVPTSVPRTVTIVPLSGIAGQRDLRRPPRRRGSCVASLSRRAFSCGMCRLRVELEAVGDRAR